VHDVVITQSQGQIHEQCDEHLSASDIGIVRARRILDDAAQAVAEGRDPRGVVRTSEENDFRDLVAITGTLSADMTKEDYVAALEKSEDLYELAPYRSRPTTRPGSSLPRSLDNRPCPDFGKPSKWRRRKKKPTTS
jgi:hypothetical protein